MPIAETKIGCTLTGLRAAQRTEFDPCAVQAKRIRELRRNVSDTRLHLVGLEQRRCHAGK